MTSTIGAYSGSTHVGLSPHQQAVETQAAQQEQRISKAIRCITSWLKGNRTTVYTDTCMQDYERPGITERESLRCATGPAMDQLAVTMLHSMNRHGWPKGETSDQQRKILRTALQRGVEQGTFKIRVSRENGAVGFRLEDTAYEQPKKETFRNDPYRVKKRHGKRVA